MPNTEAPETTQLLERIQAIHAEALRINAELIAGRPVEYSTVIAGLDNLIAAHNEAVTR